MVGGPTFRAFVKNDQQCINPCHYSTVSNPQSMQLQEVFAGGGDLNFRVPIT
jgi:hypothetical protein